MASLLVSVSESEVGCQIWRETKQSKMSSKTTNKLACLAEVYNTANTKNNTSKDK